MTTGRQRGAYREWLSSITRALKRCNRLLGSSYEDMLESATDEERRAFANEVANLVALAMKANTNG